jgi:hypothetical protein
MNIKHNFLISRKFEFHPLLKESSAFALSAAFLMQFVQQSFCDATSEQFI